MKYSILYACNTAAHGTNVASFFVALNKLSAVLPSAVQVNVTFLAASQALDKYKHFLNRIPRNFNVNILEDGMDIFKLAKQSDPLDVLANLSSDLLMAPESLASLFDAAQVKDYVSGHDSHTETEASYIFFLGGRHWRQGLPQGGLFAVRASILLEDYDVHQTLIKQHVKVEDQFATVSIVKQRYMLTPLPALWHYTPAQAPPAVPWQQLSEFIVKSSF